MDENRDDSCQLFVRQYRRRYEGTIPSGTQNSLDWRERHLRRRPGRSRSVQSVHHHPVQSVDLYPRPSDPLQRTKRVNTLTRRGIVILVSSFLGRDGPTSLRMIVVTILIQIYKKKTQNNIFRNNTISFCPSRPTLLVSAQPCWPWLCQSHATLRSCCRGRSPPSSRVSP